jgi:F-type H+-transporting ATPase subunit b
MHAHLWTFVFQTVNFLVLVWVLRRLLYRPIARVIAQRQQEIGESLGKAEADRAAAGSANAELATRQAEAGVECNRIIEAGRRQAEADRTVLLADAQQKADRTNEAGRIEVEHERAAATLALRAGAADLGVSVAERLLASVGVDDATTPLLDQALAVLGQLDPRERERLASECRNGSILRIVTAAILPGDRRAVCQAKLSSVLGVQPGVEFGEDPALIAGAEIHLPHAIVRQSWRDQLGRIRRELDADDAH